jgi:hypothetical protein
MSQITLRIYPGADGSFTWYDDGVSYAHERGDFMRAKCEWNDASRTLTIIRDAAARMPLPRTIQVQMREAMRKGRSNWNRTARR